MTARRFARLLGEVAILWLAAATATAAFLPRGFGAVGPNRLGLLLPSLAGGVGVAVLGAAGCAGLWWLLARELASQLGLAALGVLAVSLLLPGGLTPFFLPGPLALLLSAFLMARFPEGAGPQGGGASAPR